MTLIKSDFLPYDFTGQVYQLDAQYSRKYIDSVEPDYQQRLMFEMVLPQVVKLIKQARRQVWEIKLSESLGKSDKYIEAEKLAHQKLKQCDEGYYDQYWKNKYIKDHNLEETITVENYTY